MVMEFSKKKGGDSEKCHDLIPGLPSELGMECLMRVPYEFQSTMKSVCRSWRRLVSDSSFIRERRRCNKAELLLCLVQPLTSPNIASKAVEKRLDGEKKLKNESQSRVFYTPRFGLSVFNATTANWHRVAFPEEQQMPLFCECVVLQDAGKILLIGGWDPETLQPARDVYVLEFAGRKWRRGASMKESRSFFACASLGSTKVYVAGGHDDQKNALCSAEMYDVEKDEWSMIPPMSEGRDESQGFAMGTDLRFCVMSGYGTESQGKFRSDAEVYNPETNSWSKIENIWPFPDTNPRGRIAGEDCKSSSRLFCFTDGDLQSEPRLKTKNDSRNWKIDVETFQLPITGSSVFAGRLGSEAMVMVSGRRESESEGMVMKMTTEKKIEKWSQFQVPSAFSGRPFSHASIYV